MSRRRDVSATAALLSIGIVLAACGSPAPRPSGPGQSVSGSGASVAPLRMTIDDQGVFEGAARATWNRAYQPPRVALEAGVNLRGATGSGYGVLLELQPIAGSELPSSFTEKDIGTATLVVWKDGGSSTATIGGAVRGQVGLHVRAGDSRMAGDLEAAVRGAAGTLRVRIVFDTGLSE